MSSRTTMTASFDTTARRLQRLRDSIATGASYTSGHSPNPSVRDYVLVLSLRRRTLSNLSSR